MIDIDKQYRPRTEAFAAVLRAADDIWLTTEELGAHVGLDPGYLTVRRCKGRPGWPYYKTPTGGVRYRFADVVAASLDGARGPLSLHHVLAAIAATPGVDDAAKAAIGAHVAGAFETKNV